MNRCRRCGEGLLPGDPGPCGRCAAAPVVRPQLEWVADVQREFLALGPPVMVSTIPVAGQGREKFVQDLALLSGQDPWAAAGSDPANRARVAFSGRFEGTPFVLHDLRDRGDAIFLVAPGGKIDAAAALDAVMASLARAPWSAAPATVFLM